MSELIFFLTALSFINAYETAFGIVEKPGLETTSSDGWRGFDLPPQIYRAMDDNLNPFQIYQELSVDQALDSLSSGMVDFHYFDKLQEDPRLKAMYQSIDIPVPFDFPMRRIFH